MDRLENLALKRSIFSVPDPYILYIFVFLGMKMVEMGTNKY